jgi:hypothetical protein
VLFARRYPKLHALIQECWRVRKRERPNFDQIVARLQGDIGDEIKRKEEPKIEVYSKEDDEVYRGRFGMDEAFSDSAGELETAVGGGQAAEAIKAKDKLLEELKAKLKKSEEREKELVSKAQFDRVVKELQEAKDQLARASPTV